MVWKKWSTILQRESEEIVHFGGSFLVGHLQEALGCCANFHWSTCSLDVSSTPCTVAVTREIRYLLVNHIS